MSCQYDKFVFRNFDEKGIYIDTPSTLIINDINSLKFILEKYNIDKYIFRGVNNASFKSLSSLHYYMLKHNVSTMHANYPDFISNQLLPLFKHKHIFNYFLKSLNPIDIVRLNQKSEEIFLQIEVKQKLSFYLTCLLQHYGGKTPFVDFTKDINIALFFSIRNYSLQNLSGNVIEDYISVYILPRSSICSYNDTWIDSRNNGKDTSQNWSKENIQEYLQEVCDNSKDREELTKFIDNLLFNNKVNLVDYDDFLFNYNVMAQKGCFVFYQNLSEKSFEERYFESCQKKIICVEIHKSIIPEIIENILKPSFLTESTMFPNINNIVTSAFRNAEFELQKAITKQLSKL